MDSPPMPNMNLPNIMISMLCFHIPIVMNNYPNTMITLNTSVTFLYPNLSQRAPLNRGSIMFGREYIAYIRLYKYSKVDLSY